MHSKMLLHIAHILYPETYKILKFKRNKNIMYKNSKIIGKKTLLNIEVPTHIYFYTFPSTF